MRMSALFGAKHSELFEIYGMSARKGGEGEPVRTFYGRGERGQFFAILCGRLSWTAPFKNLHRKRLDLKSDVPINGIPINPIIIITSIIISTFLSKTAK